MAVDVNRQFFGDGTGALTACGTTSASTTVVVTTTALIRTNMGIDVVVTSSGATSTGATGRYVSSVASTTTFVISGAAITTDSTFSVYRAGNYGNESNGLQNIVKASGALGGLNPSTAGVEYWASTVYSNSGTTRAISEALMQKSFDAPAEVKFGTGGQPSLIIGTFGTRRAYQNLLSSLKRYSPNVLELEGGFTALEYNGLPFVVDRAAFANTVWFLDESHFQLFQVTEPGWMDDDGKVLKWDTATGYKGVYRWFLNLGTDARDAHAQLTDIIEA